MLKTKSELRVRYANTDQMKFAHHGNYPEYFEYARTEMMREIGFTYKAFEDAGFQLPVLAIHIEYLSPAYYDDLLEIETTLAKVPKARMKLDYVVRRKGEEKIITRGYSEHAFIREETKRPIRVPESFLNALRGHFDESEFPTH